MTPAEQLVSAIDEVLGTAISSSGYRLAKGDLGALDETLDQLGNAPNLVIDALVAIVGFPSNADPRLDVERARKWAWWTPLKFEPSQGRYLQRNSTPAEEILAAIAYNGRYDPATRRRICPIPPSELAAYLRQEWDRLDRNDPRWNAASFVIGCGLLAYGDPSILLDVIERLPAEPSPVRRAFLPLISRLIPFPADSKPGEDHRAAMRWARTAQLTFVSSKGIYLCDDRPA
jgi:hypothetical protein